MSGILYFRIVRILEILEAGSARFPYKGPRNKHFRLWGPLHLSQVFYSPVLVLETMRAHTLSHSPLFVTPWTEAHQAPLSMEFSRHSTGMSCLPSSRALPAPGVGRAPPAPAGRLLATAPPEAPEATDSKRTKGHGSAPKRFYLQQQVAGWVLAWPTTARQCLI